jgi:hypothetical protein
MQSIWDCICRQPGVRAVYGFVFDGYSKSVPFLFRGGRPRRGPRRLVGIGFAAGAVPTITTDYLLLKNIEITGHRSAISQATSGAGSCLLREDL